MRLFWTHKELGEPLQISSDDVTNWCIKEALLARFHSEQAKAQKKQQDREAREAFKKDPEFRKA